MIFIPVSRATVLIPTPTQDRPDLRHLFILLNSAMRGLQADVEDGVIVAGITTAHEGARYDRTCMLFAGDHPFVQHKSYVNYANCQIKSASSIIQGVNDGKLVPRDMLDPSIFARVLYGVTASPRTPRFIKTAYALAYPDG